MYEHGKGINWKHVDGVIHNQESINYTKIKMSVLVRFSFLRILRRGCYVVCERSKRI